MNMIQEDFNLKYNNIVEPDMYLGTTMSKTEFEGSNMFCKMLDKHYVNPEVSNIGDSIARDGIRLQLKCVNPLSSKYSPWLEHSP